MILFESSRTGSYQLWASNRDGTGNRKLTDVAETALGGRWSPLGDRIAFCGYSGPQEIAGVLVIDANGGPPLHLTPDEFSDAQPSWSADGKWVYYESERESISQLFRVPAEGGIPEQLTTHEERSMIPREAQDNLLLFWRDEKIWSLSLDTREEELILDRKVGQFHWTTWDGNLVYLDQEEDLGTVINVLDHVTGQTQKLLRLRKGTSIGFGFTISPDGESIIFSQAKVARADLMMVENFY
jgi:Tol biopolymer transport system component